MRGRRGLGAWESVSAWEGEERRGVAGECGRGIPPFVAVGNTVPVYSDMFLSWTGSHVRQLAILTLYF